MLIVVAERSVTIQNNKNNPPYTNTHHETQGAKAPEASLESFDSLAERFVDFCDTYSSFFKAARHNLSAKARCYLSGLLMKGERKNMERMEEYVQDYDYQSLQQFVSDSPWDHKALIQRIGKDVDALLGGDDSMLLIDESGFAKKGKNPRR